MNHEGRRELYFHFWSMKKGGPVTNRTIMSPVRRIEIEYFAICSLKFLDKLLFFLCFSKKVVI